MIKIGFWTFCSIAAVCKSAVGLYKAKRYYDIEEKGYTDITDIFDEVMEEVGKYAETLSNEDRIAFMEKFKPYMTKRLKATSINRASDEEIKFRIELLNRFVDESINAIKSIGEAAGETKEANTIIVNYKNYKNLDELKNELKDEVKEE